jgi:hypothetical protein
MTTIRNRSIRQYVIEAIDINAEGTSLTITTTDHSGWGNPVNEGTLALKLGDTIELETFQGSMLGGLRLAGSEEWIWHNSDEDIDRQQEESSAKWRAEKLAMVEENRAEWEALEASLPDWIRARIEHFREKAGTGFDTNGWGYELAIAKLAVLYAELGDIILDHSSSTISPYESPLIKDYARDHGTSGNQHDVALALAKAHLAEPDRSLAGTISGLYPMTRDPFYETEEK